MFEKFNIRQKLIFIQVAVVFFTVLLIGVVLLIYQSKNLKQNKLEKINSISSIMVYNLIPVLQFKDENSGKDILSTLRSEKLINYAVIYDGNGDEFASYTIENKTITVPSKLKTLDKPIFTDQDLILQLPIISNNSDIGTLQISTTLSDIKATFQFYIYVYLASFFIILILTLFIANFLQRLITSPIKSILTTVRKIANSSTYSDRMVISGTDELSFLAVEFNNMIDVIDKNNSRLEITVNERTEELTKQIITVNKFIKEQKDFTYVASHDLKTPIRSISSLTNFIEDDLGENLTDEIKSHLNLIRQKSHKLQNIINGVLTFLRIDKEIEKDQEFDFDAILQNIIEEYSKPNVQIKYDDKIGVLSTSLNSLKLIINELIKNALLFNTNQNKIIEIQSQIEESRLLLIIKDNGEGIEEQYYEKVFEPFRYLSNKENSDNIGIGLSLVKKLIDLNGGTISIDSKIDKGSTFSIDWKIN